MPLTFCRMNMVDVNIFGVADLYDFQFDLGFNPAVIRAMNVPEGAFLSNGGDLRVFFPGQSGSRQCGRIDYLQRRLVGRRDSRCDGRRHTGRV